MRSLKRTGTKLPSARKPPLIPRLTSPKCSPCRATILTGRNSWQLREAVSHNGQFPAGFETYPDLLERSGYWVGLTGKGWGPGDFRTLAKRTRNPAGPAFDEATTTPPTTGIRKNDYAGNFEQFLRQHLERRQHHQQAGPGIGLHFGETSQEAIPASFGGKEGLQ